MYVSALAIKPNNAGVTYPKPCVHGGWSCESVHSSIRSPRRYVTLSETIVDVRVICSQQLRIVAELLVYSHYARSKTHPSLLDHTVCTPYAYEEVVPPSFSSGDVLIWRLLKGCTYIRLIISEMLEDDYTKTAVLRLPIEIMP